MLEWQTPPDANELESQLAAELSAGRITPEQFAERLNADVERPLDVAMLRRFCDAFEHRVRAYSDMLQTIARIATGQAAARATRPREDEVDEHVARMQGQLPLWKEHLQAVYEFLTEVRHCSGQGTAELNGIGYSSAHRLADDVMRRAAQGWENCKNRILRSRTDSDYLFASTACELFCLWHMRSLPSPMNLIGLLELERAAALKALRERQPQQQLPAHANGFSIQAHTVSVNGQAVNVTGENVTVSAPQQGPSAKRPVPVHDAIRRAESYVQHHDFPGVNALAKQCECSPSTIREAIEQSEKLRRARAQHELQKPKPRPKPQYEKDASWSAQVDEAMRQLIEYAPESQRGQLNSPEMRDQLAVMESDALTALIDEAKKQAEQRQRAASRKPAGRA